MAHWVTDISQHTIIVNSKGKVLLLDDIHHCEEDPSIKIVTGEYIFPGGRINEGEDPREAAMREIKEEAGLTKVKILLPINTANFMPEYPRYSVVYLAKLLDDNEPIVLQGSEAAGYRWETFAVACTLPLVSEGFRDALRTAEKLWAIPAIREM